MTSRRPGEPQQPAAEVRLGADWVAHWLPRLRGEEVLAYLALASLVPRGAECDLQELGRRLGGLAPPAVERALAALEQHGLIELIRRGERAHVHFRCRAADGVHHAAPVRPSIREALAEHRRMMEELLGIDAQDEDEAIREEVFRRYPELRADYERRADSGDGQRAGWRLWLELALYLMSRFEERFGDLKREHAAAFKEVSAQLLRLKLEMVDQITREVLAHRDAIFPVRGQGWIAGLGEQAFVALPLVRQLAGRYRVGAEQIYVNAIEALQQEGLVVVELDAQGRAVDLLLPSTTGLSRREERLVFFRLEELSPEEHERLDETLERMAAARARYREHLCERAVEVLEDLERRHRIGDREALAQRAAERIEEALDLIREEGGDPRCTVAPVGAAELLARLGARAVARAPEPTEA
ncbi:MAG: hypothetical protein KatS3mg102_0684 [Planctomycetota bacterium]|nr:MAG: hypothetical protein KatS3mg102_0684 [Planctomycetota bacterium]